MTLQIVAIQTGTASIKPTQIRARGHGAERLQNLFGDTAWTTVPILAWAILHPEGVIVVDTGETPRAMEAGYYPAEHPYYKYALRVDVKPEQGIGVQLRALGIGEADVRTVLLTHLHTDHAGGLHDFPQSTIWVHATELANAQGEAGLAAGFLPHRFPTWFAPNQYTFADGPLGSFGESQKITRGGDVRVVPTPGHTPGHTSVIVTDGDVSCFLAGDATYLEQTLLDESVDGVSPDEVVARSTIRTIGAFVRSTPTVYLPTHDEQSVDRLRARTITAPGSFTL